MNLLSRRKDLMPFPDIRNAGPDGLVAIGGDIEADRILMAYENGIFPWYSHEEPILWWSPRPRLVLIPEEVKISKSLDRTVRKQLFQYSIDQDFLSVVLQCKSISRKDQNGTWLNQELVECFTELHTLGYAHSIEIWKDDDLVGGLYGLAIGNIFCGESMFSKLPDASKYGLIALCQHLSRLNFTFIDCQQDTSHLRTMGAKTMEIDEFYNKIELNKRADRKPELWTQEKQFLPIFFH